jgi:tetratricopeptide (TPR) repeat protein
MPFHLHASTALFQSIICRQDGDLIKSNAVINDFVLQNFLPITRLDHAILGRLHISHVENKIQQYDDDVVSVLYNWQGQHPLSQLEAEVTRRLQVVASKFLLSIGDFEAAKASLEHYLALNLSEPQRTNTHRLIVGRLAETYNELQDFDQAIQTIEPHLDKIDESRTMGRPDRRLRLAFIEANIEKGIFEHSGAILAEVAASEPPDKDDVVEQILTVRRLIAEARTMHLQCQYDKALTCWKDIQKAIDGFQQFKSRYYFVLAVVHVSIAHAQLSIDNDQDAERSWCEAIEILKKNRCEFCLPGFATLWLRRLVKDIHQSRGWLFRMMLPGGKPDFTWPPGITL